MKRIETMLRLLLYRMMPMRQSFRLFSYLFCLLPFAFSGCDTGLGEAIDLDAPTITVDTLECGGSAPTAAVNGAFCRKQVVIRGSCSDNVAVARVSVEKKDGSGAFRFFSNALINSDGGGYKARLNFEEEGAVVLKFIAEDRAGNSGARSTRQIVLLVDETAPVGGAWYIDRGINGIRCPLADKGALQGLDFTRLENRDAAQNGSFVIHGTMKDAMGIQRVTLHIKDEGGSIICDIENTNMNGGESAVPNQYAPEFRVTHEALAGRSPLLASGIHYLCISYSSEDIVTNPGPNSAADEPVELGWFVWYPESDIPHIDAGGLAQDGALYLHINETCKVDIFDDDSLEKAYCALLSEEEYASLPAKDGGIDWDALIERPQVLVECISAEGAKSRLGVLDCPNGSRIIRDETFTLSAPAAPQAMHLVALVWDGTESHTVSVKDVPVRVQNEDAPVLFISEPENNAVPAMDGNSFVIQGQTLDAVGCAYLEFVYVPDSAAAGLEEKQKKAKAWLDSLKNDGDKGHRDALPAAGEKSKKTIKDGMTMWSVRLGERTGVGGGRLFQQDFSVQLDLFKDFAGTEKDDKFFEVLLTRNDGNAAYTEYKLAGDTLPPVISASPNDMEIIEYGRSDLEIRFHGEKESGLGIKPESYRLVKVDGGTEQELKVGSGGYDEGSGEYVWIIPQDALQAWVDANDAMPKFRMYAEDVLGNKAGDQRTFLLSAWPVLEQISSNNMDGTYKAGDTITLNAVFSDAVLAAGAPRLKLRFDEGGETLYAPCSGGSGTPTLTFTYTVQRGDASERLLCFNEPGVGPFDTAGGGITQMSGGGVHLTTLKGNLQDKKALRIDGVAPNITAVNITCDGRSSGEFGVGKTIRVEAEADEDVQVQGNPQFSLVAPDGKAVLLAFERSSGRTLHFAHKIAADTANGALSCAGTLAGCIAEGAESILDKAGNCVELSALRISGGISVDTVPPPVPKITVRTKAGAVVPESEYAGGRTYKSNEDLTFEAESEAGAAIEFSTTNGASWEGFSAGAALTGAVQLAARATDAAGNTSASSPVIYLDVTSGFPDFIVECTNPDGNYAAGSALAFKATFSRNVQVAADAAARIQLSGANDGDSCDGAVATLAPGERGRKDVQSVLFTYKVRDPDEFHLKLAAGAVNLGGITDMYGNSPDGAMSAEMVRGGLRCDGVAPKVVEMTPGGGREGGSVFSQGHIITLKFSEPVERGSGRLILRQVGGTEGGPWALPPVMSVEDFNTVKNAVPAECRECLVRTEPDGTEMVDNVVNGEDSAVNWFDQMHGTGQPVGPYKKVTHGLVLSGGKYVPDTTTKYVLAFDFDIYGTDEEIVCDKTVKSGGTDLNTDGKKISARQIRSAFEKAHYHERILDATSSFVVISGDKRTATVAFQKGLTGGQELPDGRRWQLLIDKRAFRDETGNLFGAEADGSIKTESDGTVSPVAVPVGGRNSGMTAFWSDTVAEPVIRVDRHSYAFGQDMYDADGVRSNVRRNDKEKPSGFVRVRIDCETPGASIMYGTKEGTASIKSVPSEADVKNGTVDSASGHGGDTYYITTIADFSQPEVDGISSTTAYNGVFYEGSGEIHTAMKKYIRASAAKDGFKPSSAGIEGVFKTVVEFCKPNNYSSFSNIGIRGKTVGDSVPTVSGFPLRDASYASAYMRRCYRNDNSNYWWVSFDIVSEGAVSIVKHKPGSRTVSLGWSFGPMRYGQCTFIKGAGSWGG